MFSRRRTQTGRGGPETEKVVVTPEHSNKDLFPEQETLVTTESLVSNESAQEGRQPDRVGRSLPRGRNPEPLSYSRSRRTLSSPRQKLQRSSPSSSRSFPGSPPLRTFLVKETTKGSSSSLKGVWRIMVPDLTGCTRWSGEKEGPCNSQN